MPQLGLMNNISSEKSPVWANDYSIDFGGTNEILTLGSTITAADDFSVSFWFKTSDLTGQFFFGHSSTDSLAILSATSMRFVIGSESESFTSLDTMLANTWTHIVVTREAGGSNTVTVYINGVAQTDTKTNAQTFSISFIGARTLSALFYIGYIDELAIWDKELSASAVLAIYNNGTPIDLLYDSGHYGQSGDLQHFWRMGDGTLDDGNIDGNGLIADQVNPTLGSELVGTGTGDWDASSAQWADNGVGVFSYTKGADAGMTYDGDSFGAFTFSTGDTYKLTFEIAGVDPQLEIRGGSTEAITNRSYATGVHTVYIQAASDINGEKFVFYGADAGSNFVLYTLSFKKVNGNPGFMIKMEATDIKEDAPPS